jgi:serine/threonine protein kinase
MTEPVPAPPTALDPGRYSPAEVEVTELDPGRHRPRISGPAFDGDLPPSLATRFVVIRVLNSSGGEADVLHVEERSTGQKLVLKLYRDAGRDPRVRDFLRRKQVPHTVTVFEVGTEEGRDYELMEHVTGGSLVDLPTASDTAVLVEVVRQVAEALALIHAAGVVHRDVKPANVLVRKRSELNVALADFGISVYQPDPASIDDRSGTVRYMPPEFISGQLVSAAYDWWSLGATVRELATGAPLLEGVSTNEVRIYVTASPVNMQQVVDDRVRLLCQGLLAQDLTQRWGVDEVRRWLAGESPPVPAYATPTGPAEAEVTEPYWYADTGYRNRALLAAAMTATWETAVAVLYRGGPEPLANLENWLLQFGPQEPVQGRRRDPDNVRLLRLLRRMAPTHPPIYRQHNITLSQLPNLARDAVSGQGNWPEIVAELWRYGVLRLLAHGSATPDLGGGDGLDTVDARWRDRWERWQPLFRSVSDAEARDRLARRDLQSRRRALAMCLWATVADDDARAQVRRDLQARARSIRLPWFTELTLDPEGVWIAMLLREYAEDRAAARDDRERADAIRRQFLARNRRFREWSRRRNRPLALSWAVAGVFVLGVLCALLISVSDIAGQVSADTIVSAWVATVFAIAAALTFEAVLAWEIGGRFHPRYSILGAGFISLGRAARSIRGRGIALAVVVGVLGGAYLLTTFLPTLTPVVVGGAVIVWAVARYLAWQREMAEEETEARRGAEERAAANTP